MRVICCDPPGEILPIVNTLDPRITVEEDEGCAATPELTLVATVTVVLPTEASRQTGNVNNNSTSSCRTIVSNC